MLVNQLLFRPTIMRSQLNLFRFFATTHQPNKTNNKAKKQSVTIEAEPQPQQTETLIQNSPMVVTTYKEKRNAFYKLGYNENHIPHQGKYENVRKQKLEQWESPPYSWPPHFPRPTMHTGKTLLLELEKEYMDRIKVARPFKVPSYRSGDVVDVTMFRSLSEGKFNKHRGVIYSMKNPNSLDKSFKIHFNEAD